jgi:Xaa-Pro aminopeptidase
MERLHPIRFLTLVLLATAFQSSTPLFAQTKEVPDNIDRITPNEYHQRRAALLAKMEPNSIAVFKANDPDNRSNDVNYQYRQESNFLYLTGCNEPMSYLVLAPEGVQVDSVTTPREVFFVRPKQRSAAGESMGIEGAKSELGFQVVLPSSELQSFVKRALAAKKILYYSPSVPDLSYDPLMEKRYILSREVKNELQLAFPGLEIKTLLGAVAEMRGIKSVVEIALLQKAIDATVAAHIEAMKSCQPGMYEYELQAVIEYCFTKYGAEYTGFPSIVGSGPNSCILHYEANRRQTKNGDVVVMDLGAEYQGYSADVTRTIPVNGTFSPAQKAIYEIVLRAQEEAIKELKPGVPGNASGQKAVEVISDGLVKLGIIKDKSEARRYYLHGISHGIGLDVHDVGIFGKPLTPGMVLTVEPGIYIPEGSPCDKEYWNIGIRIEDDVLITENGLRVLSAGAPKTIDEIEALMKKQGLGNLKVGAK